MEQDVALNDASRDPTSSSIVTHFCLMAMASKVSPTLNPNISHDDDADDNGYEDNDEESDNIASFKIKGEMIFQSLYKNKLARSNFLEIMSIATEGKKYIEELEAHLEEHEVLRSMSRPLRQWKVMSVITLMRSQSYLKLLKINKPPRNLFRKHLL
ncbi:hypothetical protein D1007_56020 [Hordeum vulgare]|nr:hypothetical protein D1007_56020 [Hordeum vulgare]